MFQETVLSMWLQLSSHCMALDGSVVIGNTLQRNSDCVHYTVLTHTKTVSKIIRYGFARFLYAAPIKRCGLRKDWLNQNYLGAEAVKEKFSFLKYFFKQGPSPLGSKFASVLA